MKGQELKAKFTEEFFEEFQFDAEFRSIFTGMEKEMLTPYQAIEHLCKAKKELLNSLHRSIENLPTKIIVTTEELERLKTTTQTKG